MVVHGLYTQSSSLDNKCNSMQTTTRSNLEMNIKLKHVKGPCSLHLIYNRKHAHDRVWL